MHEHQIIQSETFKKWLSKVKDRKSVMRIEAGIRRMSLGNFCNCKPVRAGIRELCINHGPGYRVYYMLKGPIVIVLLIGGDKSTQDDDIERAITIAQDWKE